MFKVIKPEYTNKTFRMPTELVKALGQTAHDMGVSMNNLVVQCCAYALDNLADIGENGAMGGNAERAEHGMTKPEGSAPTARKDSK
jgi:hypothetical protein